jgi:hypothetical protein
MAFQRDLLKIVGGIGTGETDEELFPLPLGLRVILPVASPYPTIPIHTIKFRKHYQCHNEHSTYTNEKKSHYCRQITASIK